MWQQTYEYEDLRWFALETILCMHVTLLMRVHTFCIDVYTVYSLCALYDVYCMMCK